MYRIVTTDGTELGLTEELTFVKIVDGQQVRVDDIRNADALIFDCKPYNILGHTAIADTETVIPVKVTALSLSAETKAICNKLIANQDYIAMMSDIELDTDEETDETEESGVSEDEQEV